MKILLSLWSLWEQPLKFIFWAARRTGFDGVELLIYEKIQRIPTERYSEFSRGSKSPVTAVQAPHSPLKKFGGDHWDSVRKSADLASELSASLVTFRPPKGFFRDRLMSEMSSLIEELSSGFEGIDFAIENTPPPKSFLERIRSPLSDPSELKDFLEGSKLYSTLDVSNAAAWKIDPIEFMSLLSGKIRNIQLSDYSDSKYQLLPGQGNLPIEDFFREIRSQEYDGLLTLEVSKESFGTKDTGRMLGKLRETVAFISEKLDRR
jgi:sugar phosphate isomerase/epimerase